MAHDLVFVAEVDHDVEFSCANCGVSIRFNKPGVGEPCAVDNGGGAWSTPENPEKWMGQCTQ